MTKQILVVAAHPDDEVLGCGGTLAKHTDMGDEIHLVFLANGESSRPVELQNQNQRESALEQVCEQLQVATCIELDFPDNQMDELPLLHVVQKLEQVTSHLQPEIIYTHHSGDLNIDHRICHEAVLTCFRPQPSSSLKQILCFEVNSSTEWRFNRNAQFCPNHFVDISDYVDNKTALLNIYQQEMREFPHTRSIQAVMDLATVRGTTIGFAAAEAFEVVWQKG